MATPTRTGWHQLYSWTLFRLINVKKSNSCWHCSYLLLRNISEVCAYQRPIYLETCVLLNKIRRSYVMCPFNNDVSQFVVVMLILLMKLFEVSIQKKPLIFDIELTLLTAHYGQMLCNYCIQQYIQFYCRQNAEVVGCIVVHLSVHIHWSWKS